MPQNGGKKNALVAIDTVALEGKTIEKVFFADVKGGDKMYVLFTDETLVVLPVYRECPVQVGRKADLMADAEWLANAMAEHIRRFTEPRNEVIEYLRGIENGLDSS